MNYYSDNSNMQNTNTQDTYPPHPDAFGGLPTASRICGIISFGLGIFSVTACCLGYLSIPLGALGILFAMLSRRLGKQMPPACKSGIILSVIGIVVGLVMMIATIYITITDPQFWEQMQETMELYEEMYEETYGIDL